MRPVTAALIVISTGVLAAPVSAQTTQPKPCVAMNPSQISVDLALKRADAALKTSDAREAICWLDIAADKGNALAMLNLGLTYHELKNNDMARQSFLRAANKGSTDAMEDLGLLAHELHDDVAAERWYRNAIEKGDIDAYYDLGVLQNDQKAYPAALNSFLQAAQKGHSDAEYNISMMMARGLGTPKNIPEAVEWMQRSAKHGNTQAALMMRAATEQAQKTAAQRGNSASTAASPGIAPTTSTTAQERQDDVLRAIFGIAVKNMMTPPTSKELADEREKDSNRRDQAERDRHAMEMACVSGGFGCPAQ